MAEEGSIRQTRAELRRTRQRAPVSRAQNPVVPEPRRIIPENPKPPARPSFAPDVGSGIRQKINRSALNLPADRSTAVAFNAQNQADNGYREGLGMADAYQAGVGEAGETSDQSVMPTFEQTYGAENEEQQAFAGQQAQMKRNQEQFLPGSTGAPTTQFQNREVNRRQQARPTGAQTGASFGGGEFGTAAALATQRAAQQGLEDEEEGEGEDQDVISNLNSQIESTKLMISRGADAFNGAMSLATAETVIGGVFELSLLLLNMNARILAIKMKKGGLFRKFVPAAKFPIEVTAIVSADFLVFMFLFASLCLIVAIGYVMMSIGANIPGMPSLTETPTA